jgi:hypothetical protein
VERSRPGVQGTAWRSSWGWGTGSSDGKASSAGCIQHVYRDRCLHPAVDANSVQYYVGLQSIFLMEGRMNMIQNNRLINGIILIIAAFTLSCSIFASYELPSSTSVSTPIEIKTVTPTEIIKPTDTVIIRNLAPFTNLQKEIPGYVDGLVNANGAGCGGGGGPCINVNQNNRVSILFDKEYKLLNMILYVGCNDRETMDGKIRNIAGGNDINITNFSHIGCGDSIDLRNTATDRIAIIMTGGGGPDHQISVEEIEIYGQ